MNEEEWLACADADDVDRMLGYLQVEGASPRKMRLLGAACCRYLHDLLADENSQNAVATVEHFADGMSTKAALRRARQAVLSDRNALARDLAAEREARWIVHCAATENAYTMAANELLRLAGYFLQEPVRVGVFVGELLFEVFNNPFRPSPTIAPAVLAYDGGIVGKLAQSAYDERQMPEGTLDPARLAVLADALEEAGCDNAELLEHLRAELHHVRGCWAVDAVLGLS
jgi:hypothetical protein